MQNPAQSATAVVATPSTSSVNPTFDLTGYSTFALAVVTLSLAIAAFLQAYLSRRAIEQTKVETERAFGFENLRQMQTMTPIVVAEASPQRPTLFRYLNLRNAGEGPAINARFSGTLNGADFSAAQFSVAAIAPSRIVQTSLQLHKDFEARWPVRELLIRYEDIFGNTYATEYVLFDDQSEWYTWKRPWLGKELGVSRPEQCSEDEAAWGFKGRKYYDAPKGLY
jgi:hypothetical protein